MAAVLLVFAVLGLVVLGDAVVENTTSVGFSLFGQSVSGFTQGGMLAMGAALGALVTCLLLLSSASSSRRRARRKELRTSQHDLEDRIADLERENADLRGARPVAAPVATPAPARVAHPAPVGPSAPSDMPARAPVAVAPAVQDQPTPPPAPVTAPPPPAAATAVREPAPPAPATTLEEPAPPAPAPGQEPVGGARGGATRMQRLRGEDAPPEPRSS